MPAGDPTQRTNELRPSKSACSVPTRTVEPAVGSTETPNDARSGFPVCPVCGGELVGIKLKWVCSRCHTICETCCEGGPG